MLESDATLFLPIAEPTLDAVLDDTRALEHAIDDLAAHEIAALLLLCRLDGEEGAASVSPERALASAVRACNAAAGAADLAVLREHVLPSLSRAGIDAGVRRLPLLGIALLDDATLERGDCLTASGDWDFTFTERHRKTLADALVRLELTPGERTRLTPEQSRIHRELAAQSDEHLHVQGYAGTGKSALIRSLIALLEPTGARVLVLAEHQRQLDATPVDPRRATHVQKSTFAALASRIIPPDLTSPAYLNMFRTGRSRATLPDADLASALGIRASGGFATNEIVRAVRNTVFTFCRGDDERIEERHIPLAHRGAFDPATRATTVFHARELWDAIVSRPSKAFGPLIRGYHLIKWASLNRWPIPDTYTHVVIDESHDLPAAVRRILAASPQAMATLGDDYQNLRGFVARPSPLVRNREMTHSIRTAAGVEELVNPIILAHPSGTKSRFRGNRMNTVEVTYYDPARATVPGSPAAILVADTWGLFEWAQRVASGNADVDLMSARQDLDRFVKDCIELHARDTRGRHPELLRFGSWNEVAEHHHDSLGFRRIDRLLARGYGYENWSRTYRHLAGRGADVHAVGLVGNALNQEFDAVMLAPDVLGDEAGRRRAAFGSTVYVALTRARRRLIVPDGLRHWIEELSARQGVRLRGEERPSL